LEFRAGGMIGANAFALPGGIMVVTDEIITLSKNDNEIIAVLAHELGHVKQRHAFRQSLQGVLAGLILAAVTGDVSSVGSGLPAALMQMSYSREHELEADGFALSALQKACLPPKAFADILQRLQNQAFGNEKPTKGETSKKTQAQKRSDGVPEMLSTHPDTLARIQPFLAAKQNCN
jgi:Zn-dependent protease with chaperone function